MSDSIPFALNPASGVPIYQQIVEQAQALIMSGTLRPGDSLPSVRNVAKSLSVNPMTVSKAYSTLEQRGLIVRQPGVGMIVREVTKTGADVLRPDVDALIASAAGLGLDLEAVVELLEEQWRKQL